MFDTACGSAGSDLAGSDLAGLDLADALRAACEAELPRAKVPTEFCLVPELPLGATGKVSRRPPDDAPGGKPAASR